MRSRRSSSRPRGFTLVEMMVVATIMVVLAAFAAPAFRRAIEQSKADIAGANLRAIWAAERIYWLSQHQYASDLSTLRNNQPPLLDSNILTEGEINDDRPYAFEVALTSSGFTAKAIRRGTSSWTGELHIDQDGIFDNSNYSIVDLTNVSAKPIVPGFR